MFIGVCCQEKNPTESTKVQRAFNISGKDITGKAASRSESFVVAGFIPARNLALIIYELTWQIRLRTTALPAVQAGINPATTFLIKPIYQISGIPTLPYRLPASQKLRQDKTEGTQMSGCCADADC
jgi:hypothetical protein